MKDGQFEMLMGSMKELKTDVGVVRTEQIAQGVNLAVVTTKVKAHSWIHRITGLALLSLCATWVRSKFN